MAKHFFCTSFAFLTGFISQKEVVDILQQNIYQGPHQEHMEVSGQFLLPNREFLKNTF